MLCQGCGVSMGDYRVVYSDDYSQYCGACNQKYYEQRELQELLNQKMKDDKVAALIAKYGEETAYEIMADWSMG